MSTWLATFALIFTIIQAASLPSKESKYDYNLSKQYDTVTGSLIISEQDEACTPDWADGTALKGVCRINCVGTEIPVAIDAATGLRPCQSGYCCVPYNGFGF